MRAGVPAAIRWRKGSITSLDGQISQCRRPIRSRVKERKVDVNVEEKRKGIAWGQFLDPDHYSPSHWGRFGTSAAIQVLAMDLHWDRDESSRKTVSDVHPVGNLAEDVLLEDAWQDPLPGELKPEDLQDPMKVAFLVDCLSPDDCDGQRGDAPPRIAEHLISMAVDRDGWTTRPDGDEDRDEKDRLLITAYALWVLRRLPKAQMDPRIEGAAPWLAGELIERRKSLGEDILALGALALSQSHREVRARLPVEEAIGTCLVELRGWAGQIDDPTVGRPYFNCYSRGADNDYIFLSPELLTALLFLYEDRERSSRSFVLQVVESVAENVVPVGMPADLRERPHGFSIQRGMEGTVDQMWVMRLLRAFHKKYSEDPRSVKPSRIGAPGVVALIALVALIGTIGTQPEVNVVNAILLAVFGGALSVVITDFRLSRGAG